MTYQEWEQIPFLLPAEKTGCHLVKKIVCLPQVFIDCC